MEIYKGIFFLLLLSVFAACNKKGDKLPGVPPEGSVNLTDIEDKSDYYLPFAIVNDSNDVVSAVLNGEEVKFGSGDYIEFIENGFYELVLKYGNAHRANDTILFTTKTLEREESEWGIRAWIPLPYKTVSLGTESVEMLYPRRYTENIKIPFIFYVRESGKVKAVYCQGKCTTTGTNFNIKRGVGSVNLAVNSINGKADFSIGDKTFGATVSKISEAPVLLQGTINSATVIPANSFVKISADLAISPSGSLIINEGSVVIVEEAVDINVSGPLYISGSSSNPVFFTCSQSGKYWGGFITRVSTGTITAQYAIFCQSGYHNTTGYNWGHAGRQALFYTENSSLALDNCFMLDHIGQVFYPQNSTLTLNRILVQRVKTGGQINTSHLVLKNSHFTDFPEESEVFIDKDNDALYISASDAEIDSTTFMFAKDDGLDSGNTEGGDILITNSWFEGCFHEGAALSSGGGSVKNHTFRNCVFTNCGQGLELGFSSPNHIVIAENCQFLKNGIGIRYGDNYSWSSMAGKMFIKHSASLNNDKDVWNMVRMIWSPKLEKLNLENTVVSKFSPQYPTLEISH